MTVDDLYAKFLEVFGVARTHCVNMYGMTELSSQIYDQNLLSYYTDGSSNYLKATRRGFVPCSSIRRRSRLSPMASRG